MQILDKTESICPICFFEGILNKINANIIEDDEKIWMTKNCQFHGFSKEILFSDVNLYKKWIKFIATGKPISYIKTDIFSNSKLYTHHLSQAMLTNLIVTNRYNTKSNQNFFDANVTGYVYEPSLNQLQNLIDQIKGEKSLGSKTIQIIGGEPTIRQDLFEIIRIVKRSGFPRIQIQTNGIKLANSLDYCQSLKNEKVDTIYLIFNGVNKTTNPLIDFHKRVIENCYNVNLNIVLTPIFIGTKNLQEAGKIVRFAIDNNKGIKGVHFQLFFSYNSTLTISKNERGKQHIDSGTLIHFIEQEFHGGISCNDFYPYCFIFPISKFIELITNEYQTEPTIHPMCGGSTFIFIEDGKPLPLTRFINVESFIKFLTEQTMKKGPLRKLRIASSFMKNIDTFVDFKKAPKGFYPKKILKDATILGSEYALRDFRNKTIFIGFMEYQDIWHLDISRLKRCSIWYPTFEGTIPYCSFHALGYGYKILERYSIPINDWNKKNSHSIKTDSQKRL